MTRTSPDPVHEPGKNPGAARPTRLERAVVLGGFAVAALATAPAFLPGGDLEVVAALWLAAAVWAFIASLALALRRGIRRGDRSAFRRCELPENNDTLDWSYGNGIFMGRGYEQDHDTTGYSTHFHAP